MSIIRPFKGIRPATDLAASIAALPYDVYSSKEAREIVSSNPMSFLKIDRAETLLPEGTDLYSPEVYQTARRTLDAMIEDGSFIQDTSACYYIYALTMDGRTQTGLVGCAAIDDYINNVILKTRKTPLPQKRRDRIRHVDACSAQTGPIFSLHTGHIDRFRKLSIRRNPCRHSMILSAMTESVIRYGESAGRKISITFLNYSKRFPICILRTDTTAPPPP